MLDNVLPGNIPSVQNALVIRFQATNKSQTAFHIFLKQVQINALWKSAFENKIPPFEIKDGVLDLKDSNFVVFQEENWTFVLNDKEPAKDLLKDYESGIAFGNESLIIKYDNNKITEANYSNMNQSLNDNALKNSINSLERTFGNT